MKNSPNKGHANPAKWEQDPAGNRGVHADKILWGLLVRRQCWSLSIPGKLVALALLVAVSLGTVRFIHPFLAPNHPVAADVLIVEGRIPSDTMHQAAAEFLAGGYQRLILMRPITDADNKYESGRYMGDYMANLLVQYGVPATAMTTLFPVVAQKDRTYHAALAARQWLREQRLAVKSVDVATLGPHARRSRLLYEKAFGHDVTIGIIALANRTYDPAHWWRSSEGVREVVGETIAYGYARIFFWPSN